jgi:hypothetical protein
MIKHLVASLLSSSCFIGSNVEVGDKIISYESDGQKKISLNLDAKTHECIHDIPGKFAAGIQTVDRYRCGPLVVFTQLLFKRCSSEDYNPSPNQFYSSSDSGKRLLQVQHDCFKNGIKSIGMWHKIRDKNQNEWELDKMSGGYTPRESCTKDGKISTRTERFTVQANDSKIEIITTTKYPVRSVKPRPSPTF